VVPGAQVLVTNNATGLSRSVTANSDGLFNALNIPVGTYTVTTTMAGFKKSVISGVVVDVGAAPAVPVVLSIGATGETVQVTADAAQIQTTTAQIGAVVTSTEATQIQLNGRNYVQLLTLQPGVSQTVASGFAIFGTYGVNGNSQSVDGVRTDSANFFIDGVDNKDNGGGGNNFVNISPDSLQEFRNVASSYDASYGGTSGATVTVAVKSGGRSFHGSAYEYLRNDAIQAYQYRAPGITLPKTPLRYNDFGYTIGGPIWIPGHFNEDRSKLFFFAGQEFKRLRSFTNQTASVPTPAAVAAAIASPTSTATGRALANTLLTSPTGVFGYSSLGNNNQSEYLVKIDYNPSSKNQINGHFVHDNVLNVGNPTNYVVYDRTIPGLTSSVQWTHTFNEKTVNTAVVSYSGNIINEGNNIRANPQFGKKILRSDYGLTYATLFNASPIIPQITVSGFGNPGAAPRQFDNYQRIYAAKDDFSRVIGNHSLKAGAYFWRARKNQTAPPQLNGAFTFSSLANLTSGNFTAYSEGSNIPQVQSRFLQFETYVQDDWTVNHRLTLNLGLRWQYMPPLYSWANNASGFFPQYYDPTKAATISPSTGLITANPSPYNGLVLPGSGFSDKAKQVVSPTVYNNPQVQLLFHNLSAGLVNPVYNTFAPRFGFAYDVTGQQETVIRGGFGVSYERVEGNYYYNSVSQLPFTAVASLAGGNADNVGGAGAAAASPTAIGNTPDPNLAPPRIFNYSLGIQQRFGSNTVFELNYVGSRSGNLTWVKNLNQAPAGTEQANPGVNRNALRPYKGYGDISQYTNGATSNYNSLQARLQTHFRQGGLFTVSFTWSKALSEGSAYNYAPQDAFNLHGDYGPASFNQPKILVVSYVYPLPFWLHDREWYKQVLGGWQLSGVGRVANGLPINVVQATGVSTAGNAVATTGTFLQRPNLIGNPYAHGGKQYLSAAAFQTPAAGTYGNFEYDGALGPLYNNWDVALQKNIPIRESVGAEFRVEMFNAPNHLSPFTVANTLGSGNFGQVTGASDPRTLEGVFRFHF